MDVQRERVEEGLGRPQEVGKAVSTNEGGKKGRVRGNTEGQGLMITKAGAAKDVVIRCVRDRVVGG
jgi:hypothetical protein